MTRLFSFVRLLRNVVLLLLVGLAAACIRQVRRWRKLPPRIWHGMFCSHLIPLQVSADRAAGFPSRSVVTSIPLSYELVRPDQFIVVLDQRGVRNHNVLWAGLFDLMLRGDIWVAFFDGLFYPIEREWENRFILRFLRMTGVRIVMVNYGGDVAIWQENRGRYDWLARLRKDYPHWDIEAESPKTAKRVALFCEHAAFVCNGDSSIDRMMPRHDLVFKYFPVNCRDIEPRTTTGNAVPVVMHAPQHRFVKGTDHLLQAAESLAAKGFRFELRLVERIPHRDALRLYATADVIADQFCIGAWGAFAQEGLAMGKPVLTYLDQEHLRDRAFNLPIVNTNPENLERVLAVLVSVPELRTRLGTASRAAVERYQSPEAIGEAWGRIYEHVWRGRPLDLESTMHFGPSRKPRSLTEDPGDPDFWPVPVSDLMPAIAAAVEAASSPPSIERRVVLSGVGRSMSASPTSGSCSLAIVAPSAFLIGGVQTWLDYLVPGLAVAKWDIDVLLVHGAHSDADRYLQHHPFSRVRKVINPSGSREGRVRALANAIEATGADLVLGVNIADVYEAVARLREQRGRKTRVAMALHGLQASFYQDIATWKESLDAVIATNRLSVAVATRLGGLPESRTHYAPCGVPVPASAPSLESFAESSIGSSSALTLLFAGRLEADEKRVLDLPPILRALERDGVPWRLRIAGSGASESSLRAELAQFGPRVEFVGVLSESEMRHSFLRPGAVALILSPCETGPLVAWEALANGVAVVTSRFVGIGLEGSLRDGETCLTFPVGDSEAAANAIARLMDLALRRRLVDAGYRLVKERYSREASIRAWDDALRRVLATPPLARTAAKVEVPASGRLDRWLGAGRAESLRTMAGLHYAHREPGGEWPHSYGTEENPDFHRVRNALDQPHVATHGA